MVVTFIVDKPGLIIVLDNIRIGSIDNVAPIAGENTMVFEFVRSGWKEEENSEKRYSKAEREICLRRWQKADCEGIRSGSRLK